MNPGVPGAAASVPATRCRHRDPWCQQAHGELGSGRQPADNGSGNVDRLLARLVLPSWFNAAARFKGTDWLGLNSLTDRRPDLSHDLVDVEPAALTTEPPAATSAALQSNWPMALLNQKNRIGGESVDLYSGNAHWSLPLVSLPGRAGMDLNLALSLNSLIWTKDGSTIHFNLDNGFPTAGFRLGFPELGTTFYNTEADTSSYLVTMPSGQRYEFRQNFTYGSNVYEELGSTYMLLIVNDNVINYRDTTWTLLTTDGTKYTFRLIANNPKGTEIKDHNGNYISITYTPFEKIKNITDTLGRVITFNYDTYNHLISITQPWSGQTHTWATYGVGQ